jgi:hypothetical protein
LPGAGPPNGDTTTTVNGAEDARRAGQMHGMFSKAPRKIF